MSSRTKTVTEISRDLGLSRQAVYDIRKRLQLRGTLDRRPGQGRKRSIRTKSVIQAVKRRIKRNPIRTMRGMARDMKINECTMRKIVKKDLKAKSRARCQRHIISGQAKAKRLERSKKLLTVMKKKPPVILFSDEKLFRVDSVSNSRNCRYISPKKPSEVPDNVKYGFKTKNPASLMVLGVIASNGKVCPPIFIRNNQRIDASAYIQLLETHVMPWITKEFRNEPYIWQQDGAPCHTARMTQKWLQANMKNYWPKEMWPPNSPDLNPLDFSIWAFVENLSNKRSHGSVASLEASIKLAWTKMSEEYISRVCQSFRRRLEAVIAANGGHIEEWFCAP